MGALVGDFEGSIHPGTHDDERPIVLERTNRATLDPWNMEWNLWTEYSVLELSPGPAAISRCHQIDHAFLFG